MAIADAKKRRIGYQLIDWVYLGIRSGARQSVEEFRRYEVSSPAIAEEHLKRAVNMPLRARARFNETKRLYELENGVGTFNAFITGCLTLSGSVTLADLNTELTNLENYANSLIARKQGGEALSSIAADIEANVRNEALDWVFPFPSSYVDSW